MLKPTKRCVSVKISDNKSIDKNPAKIQKESGKQEATRKNASDLAVKKKLMMI